MTFFLRTKYVALMALLMIAVNDIYANKYPTASPDYMDYSASPDYMDHSASSDNYMNYSASPNNMSYCNVDPCCKVKCCNHTWVSADLIYLRACQDGFGCAYGTTDILTTVSDGRVVTDIYEEDNDIDFHWNAGFRLGAGYSRDCCCWDTMAYWTHFNEKGKGHDCDNHATWKLYFNELDVLIGYRSMCGECFSFKPFFGARYAKIDQTLSTHLEATITVPATNTSSLAISTKKDKEHFWGAGPVIGFEADFYFGCNFSVYGNLSGNLLYGAFKNTFNDSDIFTAAVNNCNATKHSCAVLTGLDAGLGVCYKVNCVILQLGLEHHLYFDYNQIGCGGDLNLYGINASIIIPF